MTSTCVPIIVITSYLIGEIYKVIFKNNQDLYKLIPIIVSIFGGLIGILIYYTEPIMIFNVNSVYEALEIGIVSGFSSTGTNQVIKQFKTKK